MEEFKLSIIVPVYNVEKYIETCVESIYNQGLSNNEFEVIIINDGSTDNSLSIANKLAERHSNISLFSQVNQGLSATRNHGIQKAKGTYLFFLDSDDLLIKNTLRTLLDTAYSNQVDILKADYIKANNQEISESTYGITSQIPINPIVKTGEQGFIEDYNPMYSYAVLNFYRREFIISQKLYFLEGKYFEDVAYTIEAYIKAKRFIATPLKFYIYRQNDSSIMATMNVKKLYSMNDIIAYNHQQKNKISLSKKGLEKLDYSIYASLIVNLWYLSHHRSLYPHRMEVINDLKKKVPGLYFKGSFKQHLVSFCYTYIPDLYIRIRYLLATKKYN